MTYQLTARQLYYLGKLLDAKYIEYTYVSAVEQILDSFETYENEIRDELIAKGYLSEDFSGEITLNDDLKQVVSPLFFSAKEASIDVCQLGEDEDLQSYRIHVMDDKITLVENEEDHLKLENAGREDVEKIIDRILPEDYTDEKAPSISAFEAEKISEMITVKSADPETKCVTKTFVMTGGFLYEESTEDVISSVSKDKFIQDAQAILSEVI